MNNPNRRIRYVAFSSIKDASSIIGRNLCYISRAYGINKESVMQTRTFRRRCNHVDDAHVALILELRMVLQQTMAIDFFSYTDTKHLIDFLCTI
jgi:hypothetical protein